MNPYTGHLVDLNGTSGRTPSAHDYEVLPPELERAARLKLAGKPEAYVNLRSSSQLAKWAKKRREKIAAKSRRANRRKGS